MITGTDAAEGYVTVYADVSLSSTLQYSLEIAKCYFMRICCLVISISKAVFLIPCFTFLSFSLFSFLALSFFFLLFTLLSFSSFYVFFLNLTELNSNLFTDCFYCIWPMFLAPSSWGKREEDGRQLIRQSEGEGRDFKQIIYKSQLPCVYLASPPLSSPCRLLFAGALYLWQLCEPTVFALLTWFSRTNKTAWNGCLIF